MMENPISTTLTSIQDSDCSPFFIVSSALSLLTGEKNRQLSREKAEDDRTFQEYLDEKKQEFDNKKEAEEWAFKKWLKEKQREFEREESQKRLRNDYELAELKLLFNDWPLHVEINTILQLYLAEASEQQIPLNIILGKHSVRNEADIISKEYDAISDETTRALQDDLRFDERVFFRFREDNKTTGGAALANVYALMNRLPSLMLMPNLLDNRMYFNVGIWGQDSIFPLQKSVFSTECIMVKMNADKKYCKGKMKEIILSQITIAGVMNDAYRMVEYNIPPVFPQLAKKYELLKYPHLTAFATREYASLKESAAIEFEGKSISSNDAFSKKDRDNIAKHADEALNYLNEKLCLL